MPARPCRSAMGSAARRSTSRRGLCSTAEAGETIATQTVRHLAGPIPDIAYEELAPTELKGLNETVTPVRVAFAGDDGAGRRGRTSGRRRRRQRDRRSLRISSRSSRSPAGRRTCAGCAGTGDVPGHGDGRCVVLSGQPGIGKTRLASELATFAYAAGARVSYVASSASPEDLAEISRRFR